MERLILLPIPIVIGLVTLLIRRNDPSAVNGISIKYHKFLWYFMLPSWTLFGILNYLDYEPLIDMFPFSVIAWCEFVQTILCIATFIGFFGFRKFSWYTVVIRIVMSILESLFTELYMMIALYEMPNIPQIMGYMCVMVPTLIYYLNRKSLFNDQIPVNKPVYERVITPEYPMNDVPFVRTSSENEVKRFCKYCGVKVDSGSKFCKVCGQKIS